MSLHATLVGPGRPQLAFLHGLFGQGRNWNTIARALADRASSVLFDLPNHGHSPWTASFSYEAMADAVTHDIEERLGSAAAITLIGHSMGGKTAMLAALRRPDLVRALVVIDIAPEASSHGYGMGTWVAAMRALDVGAMSSREEATLALEPVVPSLPVRTFLAQNLRRRRGASGLDWQCNLALLAEALPELSGWPDHAHRPYPGPVVWVRGAESEYVREEHFEAMLGLFPRAELLTIPDAGHWVHTDAPLVLVDALAAFLDAHALGRDA